MLCLCEFCGGIEVSLAECRAPAAAPMFHERHFKSERFQHFHRCNADVRLVITHKGVVPKNDVAASGERGRLARCFGASPKTGVLAPDREIAASCVSRGA